MARPICSSVTPPGSSRTARGIGRFASAAAGPVDGRDAGRTAGFTAGPAEKPAAAATSTAAPPAKAARSLPGGR